MVYCKTRVGVVLLVVSQRCFVKMDLMSYTSVEFYICGYTYGYIHTMVNMLHVQDMLV